MGSMYSILMTAAKFVNSKECGQIRSSKPKGRLAAASGRYWNRCSFLLPRVPLFMSAFVLMPL